MVQRRQKAFRKVTPEQSAEMQARHTRLKNKYLADADALLQKRDYLQASEKYWGAAAQTIKNVAAKRGLEVGTHRSIAEFISLLDHEHPELSLWNLYGKANELHINFYEDNMPSDRVKTHGEAVKELIEKLRRI